MTLHLLHADTYLASILGSIDSQGYRHAYGILNGVKTDLTQDGLYSCAFFVSAILVRFQLLKEPHLRVQGTMRDLEASGWKETQKAQIGDILIWEAITEDDGDAHLHIGFYMGEDQAISNLTSHRAPGQHHWTFGTRHDNTPVRPIVHMFTHPTFFKEASYR